MRRAQSWTVDFTLGMLMFLAALTIVSTSIGDVLEQRGFNNLFQDATRVSEALVNEGFPTNWDSSDVVRAGLLSDGRLSWRKLGLMHNMDANEMNQVLPSAYNYAFVLQNSSGSIIAYDDECSFGKERITKSTTPHDQYVPVAYYSRSAGPNELKTYLDATLNATLYEDDQILSLLRDSHLYGVIVFEDPYFNQTLNTTLTATLLREEFRNAATYGPVIVVTGMLGTPVLGVNTSIIGDNGTVSEDETLFLLNESDPVNFTTQHQLAFMPKEGGILGNLDGSTHQKTLISSGLAAKWQYEDASVYYFSDTEGKYDANQLRPVLQEGITRAAFRSSINCSVQPELINARDLVKIERLVADRGELLTLQLYMWRNP